MATTGNIGSPASPFQSIYFDTSVVANGNAITAAELAYVAGVSSAIQTQLNLKAPLASPTFTGTITIPTPFTLGAVSVTATGTELNYVAGVTSAIQTQITAKAADSAVVHNTGIESVAGTKTFSSTIKKDNGSTDDSTFTNLEILGGDGTARVDMRSFTTTGITTAKKIYDLSQYGVLLIVNLSDGSGNIATDLIWGAFGKTPSVISAFTGLGSPATRTYSEASGALKVAMSSGTYTANVLAFEMRAR